VFAIADRIAVLRLGELVDTIDAKDTDTQQIVELMTTGRSGGQSTGER
jgi:D-xylose transport system permease protein